MRMRIGHGSRDECSGIVWRMPLRQMRLVLAVLLVVLHGPSRVQRLLS